MIRNNILINTFILIFAGFLVTSCSSVRHSHWYNPGNNKSQKELSPDSYSYNNSTGMMYRIANSKDSLYIDLKFPDQLTRMKVMGFGLTVWIDPGTKNNKRFGIKYPLGNRKQVMRRGMNPGEADVKEGEHGMLQIDYSGNKKKKASLRPKLINKEMKLLGFSGPGSVMKEPLMHSDIRIGMRYGKSQSLTYHLALPLQRITSVTPLGSDSLVSIGFVTGHMDPDKKKQERRRPSVGGGGGMPPMGGGAPPASSGRQMMGRRDHPLAKRAMLWLKKVKLASKPDGRN